MQWGSATLPLHPSARHEGRTGSAPAAAAPTSHPCFVCSMTHSYSHPLIRAGLPPTQLMPASEVAVDLYHHLLAEAARVRLCQHQPTLLALFLMPACFMLTFTHLPLATAQPVPASEAAGVVAASHPHLLAEAARVTGSAPAAATPTLPFA